MHGQRSNSEGMQKMSTLASPASPEMLGTKLSLIINVIRSSHTGLRNHGHYPFGAAVQIYTHEISEYSVFEGIVLVRA